MPRPFKYSKDQNPVYSIEISQSPVPARNRGTLDIINQELTITVLNSRNARKKNSMAQHDYMLHISSSRAPHQGSTAFFVVDVMKFSQHSSDACTTELSQLEFFRHLSFGSLEASSLLLPPL
jgi:hypothetical protein